MAANHGRGTPGNAAGRFERFEADPFDDGWGEAAGNDVAVPTTLLPDRSRTAISRNTSADLGFDRAANPYRGCEHGCTYCYARPTHAYLGYSPGLDFESRILFKPELAALLEQELGRPGYVPDTLVLGSVTDPYQPAERGLRLSRGVLEVMDRFGHPVSLVTKGAGVLRDLDLLRRLAERNLVRVWISVTTLDPALARSMEPRAATPARRLDTIGTLAASGVPVGVLAAPVIPGLNDHELERILRAAAERGAGAAGWTMIRLPGEVAALFEDWLRREQPLRAEKVMALIRGVRGGRVNDPRFGSRMRGEGPYAELLRQRFLQAARRLGLRARGEDPARGGTGGAAGGAELRHFRVPAGPGAGPGSGRGTPRPAVGAQGTLF